MEVAKSLWAMVQGDPKFMRRVNGWLAIFWLAMIPISIMLGWINSVVFVSALSLWALVSGHWAAWQASRVEVEQQKEEHKDTAGQIAKRIIKESNLRKSRAQAAARHGSKKTAKS